VDIRYPSVETWALTRIINDIFLQNRPVKIKKYAKRYTCF
jgi:uncharacterized membrane protein YfbV (UPF0208 family)